jgi:hypothetical protein
MDVTVECERQRRRGTPIVVFVLGVAVGAFVVFAAIVVLVVMGVASSLAASSSRSLLHPRDARAGDHTESYFGYFSHRAEFGVRRDTPW